VESVQKYAKKEKFPPMLTLDKKQSANYFLLELLAEQTILHELVAILKRKHGSALERVWSEIGGESSEDTNFYDDWMEYQSLKMTLKDLAHRILEIRRGDFSFA
jgi:hypothetical protein